jgi:hypothetical protein
MDEGETGLTPARSSQLNPTDPMKTLRRAFALSLLGALTLTARAAEPGFQSLFNGKDLTGWDGLKEFWSVRDGAITGQTTLAHPLKSNTFLIWQDGEVRNFELRLSFKLTGQNEKNFGNSGIQYRSRVVDAAGFVLAGYQADMDLAGTYVGMLYEEKGRGILMKPGQTIKVGPMVKDEKTGREKAKVEVVATQLTADALRAAYKVGEWNEFVVIARGNHFQHFLNGQLTADVTDDDPAKAASAGVLGLQLHAGTPMTIQFKDLRLQTLP